MTYVTFKSGMLILDVAAYLASPEGKAAVERISEQSERFRRPEDEDRYTLTESGYRAVMQQGAKLNGEVKAGEEE